MPDEQNTAIVQTPIEFFILLLFFFQLKIKFHRRKKNNHVYIAEV